MFEGIIEVFDEFYSTNLSHETIKGMKENAKQGFFNGGTPPYGYEATLTDIGDKKVKRMWKVNETEAENVQKIFNLCLGGLGAKEIVKLLASQKIKKRDGDNWNKPHIYYMLKNENYTGTYVWNRKGQGRYENHHSQIIDTETFTKVQQILARRSPKQIHPREVSSNHLLLGLMFCECCNKKMKVVSGKSGKFKYYHCPNSLNMGKHVCKNKSYNTEKANDFIIKTIKERVLTEAHIVQLVDLIDQELKTLRVNYSETITSIESKLSDIEKRTRKLYESLETGKLGLDDIAPRLKELNANKNALLAEHEEINLKVGDGYQMPKLTIEDVKPYVDDLKNTLNKSLITEQKCFIRSFVKKITINHPNVEIEYTVPLNIPNKKEPLKKEVLSVLSFNKFGSRERARTSDQSVTDLP